MRSTQRVLGLALALTLSTGGCHPRFLGNLFGLAVVTAAVVGTANALAHHDGHFHGEYCGHHRRYHEGRWVYHYNGLWEYHEGGRWYYYAPAGQPATLPPQPGTPVLAPAPAALGAPAESSAPGEAPAPAAPPPMP